MSGFEIVGVVLGAIPLIISAIDKYKTTKRTLGIFRGKIRLANDLILSLKEQKFFIECDISMILAATSIDQTQIQQLLQKPTSGILENPILSDEIKQHLGDGFGPYMAALARCEQKLTEIAKSLTGLVSSDQESLSSLVQAYPPKNGFYEFTRKIKLSLAQEDLQFQIMELDKSTLNLERIRRYSKSKAEIPLSSRHEKALSTASFLEAVSTHACHLHSAISIGYKEQCHSDHEAQLFLQHRLNHAERTHPIDLRPLKFTLGFGPAGNCGHYKTDILVAEWKQSLCKDSITMIEARTSSQSKGPLPSEIEPNLKSRPTPIHNICQHSSILKSGTIILSGTILLCPFPGSGSDVTSDCDVSSANLKPLDVLLENLSLNQRMALSLDAISSVMQLNQTPWLDMPFNMKMIYLLQEGPLTPDLPVQPLIRRSFLENPQKCQRYNARSTMLELGILLLELWEGQTFDSFVNQCDIPAPKTPGTRYDAARQWVEESMHDIMPFFLGIVERCVECNFATSPESSASFDWQDKVFRSSVCEYVLKPLRKECRLI